MNTAWVEIRRNNYYMYIFLDNSYVKLLDYMVSPFFECKIVSQPSLNSWRIFLEYNDNLIIGSQLITPHFANDIEPQREYYFNDQLKTILICKPRDLRLKLQIAVRLSRDIIKHLYLQDNSIFFHGGMISYEGKGICFLGDKKAGKTSIMLSLLATNNASFISNDDVSVTINEAGNCVGYGWPRAISIRKDSLNLMNNVLGTYDFDNQIMHPDNCFDKTHNYLFLYPNELAKIFSCNISTESKIDMILIPHFSNNTAFSFREVPYAEKCKYLKEFINKDFNKYFTDFAKCFTLPDKPNNSFEIIAKIKMYYVSQNIAHMDLFCDWIRRMLYA